MLDFQHDFSLRTSLMIENLKKVLRVHFSQNTERQIYILFFYIFYLFKKDTYLKN